MQNGLKGEHLKFVWLVDDKIILLQSKVKKLILQFSLLDVSYGVYSGIC